MFEPPEVPIKTSVESSGALPLLGVAENVAAGYAEDAQLFVHVNPTGSQTPLHELPLQQGLAPTARPSAIHTGRQVFTEHVLLQNAGQTPFAPPSSQESAPHDSITPFPQTAGARQIPPRSLTPLQQVPVPFA